MAAPIIPPFSVKDLRTIGAGLNRPECVVAALDGTLFTGDWAVGIARIGPDGVVSRAVEADLITQGFLPNGIALTPEGEFYFANLGEAGGVWAVGRTGVPRPLALEVDGRPIPPANFVLIDGDRTWITVSASTRKHSHFTAEEKTGEIILLQNGRTRVVASGLTWTNELRISSDGQHLYANETFACRTTRYDLAADGSLSNPHHFQFPSGTFPDGMAFDREGALWIVCVVSNRLIRLLPDGRWDILFEDLPENFHEICVAHSEGQLTRAMIVDARGAHVANLSSLAFGGSDGRTLYLGALSMDRIHMLRAPVPGQAMAHLSNQTSNVLSNT